MKPINIAINSEASVMIFHDGWYSSSSSAITSPSMTVSSGSFARPLTTFEYRTLKSLSLRERRRICAAGLERDGPIAVKFQLVFPPLAVIGNPPRDSTSLTPQTFGGRLASADGAAAPEKRDARDLRIVSTA
jgi:hypothetical protein